jgi:flagellin
LQGGAAKLVNADLNQESASLLTLQTRQQLGTIGLSIAQQSEQAILRLF